MGDCTFIIRSDETTDTLLKSACTIKAMLKELRKHIK